MQLTNKHIVKVSFPNNKTTYLMLYDNGRNIYIDHNGKRKTLGLTNDLYVAIDNLKAIFENINIINIRTEKA